MTKEEILVKMGKREATKLLCSIIEDMYELWAAGEFSVAVSYYPRLFDTWRLLVGEEVSHAAFRRGLEAGRKR